MGMMKGKPRALLSALASLSLILPGAATRAAIVALDIDLPLDQIAPGRPFKPGDHHRARVFYDDATIDPGTHIAPVLHMQHWVGPAGWVPKRVDAVAMPMTDAWLDLSRKPYRYHYRSAVIEGGEAVLVDFDEQTQRLSIRQQSDQSVIISAPYSINPSPVKEVDTRAVFLPPPAYILYDVDVAIDQVAAGEHAKVGDHDKVRVVYDYSELDRKSHRVGLKNLQHFIMGKWQPEHPDPTFMPMGDAWLDLHARPYAIHFRAQVTHGKPISIELDEHTRRLTIRSHADPNLILLSGPYQVEPRPITGPDAIAAATAGETR
jgi:hypothetical protein